MLKTVLKHWLLAALIVTALSGLIYVVAQQGLRQGANDPQIQLAEDTANRLAQGQTAQQVIPTEKVDIAHSLATYLIVYDRDGKAVASSAQLNGKIPTVPSGIIANAHLNGEDRITWQPQPGVRSAIVVVPIQGGNQGFVLAGRSLREVEMRTENLFQLTLLSWGGTLLITLIACVLLFWRRPLRITHHSNKQQVAA
ncbi:hypothetical protein [Ktedonospora formicarum]|uniref:Uncharacterized protein n=1 Tax=Ktedonospora formicarum TaxID=2778364 RepID=A0A8J3MU54_9CHLR|nr:hypothetical protein [Ktedonospora formicarum]GHO46586.1 hypothetical protein KSX_47490 [Ktedonospora formicarum]